MTRLLVSVRDEHEARAALAGGADIIDVKEPLRGSLGMVPLSCIDAVIRTVNGACPVSAAMGELHECNPIPGTDLFKIGLAGAPSDWRQRLPVSERFVAVAYADGSRVSAPPVAEVIDWAIEHRVAGVLIDTAVKDGRNLLDWCEPMLPAWIDRVREAGLFLALAGSLNERILPRVLDLGPDIVAVRGAACVADDRNGRIDADRVRAIKLLIESRTAPAAAIAD